MGPEYNPADEGERPWTGIYEDELTALRRKADALDRVNESTERVTKSDPYKFSVYTNEAAYGFRLAMDLVKQAIADAGEETDG